MAGPWEKYAQPASSGPWTKYSQPAPEVQEVEAPRQLRPALTPEDAGADAGMHLLSSMIAAPASGIAGLFGGADAVERVSEALTYQPRTIEGQKVANVVAWPFEKLAQFGDYVGGGAAEASGSPGLGAGINTAIQAIPSIFLKGRGAKPAPQPRVAPSFGGRIVSPQEAAARQYVSSFTSLDWNALSSAVKQRLTDIAADGTALSRLDPASFERQARLQSLPVPVPATKGILTRDPVQLRNESNVAATDAGKPIRDIHVAANKALLENLEVLKKRQGGKSVSPEQVGSSVQGAARANLDLQKQKVKSLYQQAEAAGELQGSAPTRALARLIDETPDKMHLSWVDSWLKKADVVTDQVGKETKGLRYKASLKELEDLRQAAVARAMNGGTEGYYAGKVISAIDEATDGVGGSAYKAARAARKQQAMEFEEQSGVARLVDNKSRTDRAIALEDTWRKTVLGGSIQDLRAVQKNLLTGKNVAQGRDAWRDLRAETIQHIINEATKSVSRFEDGTPNITPAAMERAIKSVGPEKMRILFGQQTIRQINEVMEATRVVKTEPPQIHKGSSTVSNVLSLLEKHLGRIPVIGDVGAGVIMGGRKLREMGRAGREIKEAQQTPLDQANALAGRAVVDRRNKNALRRYGPYGATTLDDQ